MASVQPFPPSKAKLSLAKGRLNYVPCPLLQHLCMHIPTWLKSEVPQHLLWSLDLPFLFQTGTTTALLFPPMLTETALGAILPPISSQARITSVISPS